MPKSTGAQSPYGGVGRSAPPQMTGPPPTAAPPSRPGYAGRPSYARSPGAQNRTQVRDRGVSQNPGATTSPVSYGRANVQSNPANSAMVQGITGGRPAVGRGAPGARMQQQEHVINMLRGR